MMQTFNEFFNFPEEELNKGNELIGDTYAYTDVNVPTIEDQKFLANFYETSLSLIELTDHLRHVYSVTTEDKDHVKVVLISKENAEIMCNNAYTYFINTLEQPMKDIQYEYIESVGKINLFKYLDNSILESNFKLKFNIVKFLEEKYEYKLIKEDEKYFIFE